MFNSEEKSIVLASLTREMEAVERFIKKASGHMKESAEKDLAVVGKVADKVRASPVVK